MMKRNCNLELRLFTPAVHFDSADFVNGEQNHPCRLDMDGGSPKEEKTLTIFYKGRVSAYDVTEHQARSIIMLASREKESNESPQPDRSLPLTNTRFGIPTTGLSMKRSLQRFLQKRNARAQSIFPYSPRKLR